MKKKCTILKDRTSQPPRQTKKRTFAVAFDIKTSTDFNKRCNKKMKVIQEDEARVEALVAKL